MAARTQLRTVKPYTGRRYGSFAAKANVPDFMRGTLNIFVHLSGEVKCSPTVSGDVSVRPTLLGRIETNP